MKHLSGCDNIFETKAWYFQGNMKVLLGHLDWELGTKDPLSDPAHKTILGLCIGSNVQSGQTFCYKGGKNVCRWLLCYEIQTCNKNETNLFLFFR